MQKVKLIIALIAVLSITVQAQQKNNQSGNQQLKNAQQRANTTDQDSDSVENSEANTVGTADTPGASEAATDANNNNSNQSGGQGTERASNTPAVPQINSSDSGSPAVLSKEDGKGRDGTNNVQRATMNMVGSPANNLRIPRNSSDPNSEMKDRQNYEQAKETSAENQQNGGGTINRSSKSSATGNKTRRENNAASDQNLSSKEGRAANKDGERRSEEKSRKKKGKG